MKKFLLLFVCVMLLLVFGTVQANAKSYKEIVLNKFNAKGNVSLPADSILVLKLSTPSSKGFIWQVMGDLKGVVKKLEGSPFGPDEPEFEKKEKAFPGSPQTQIIRLAGNGMGKVKVKLVCHRPWFKDSQLEEVNFTLRSKGKFIGTFEAPQMISAPKTEDFSDIYAPGLPSHFDWRDTNQVTPVKDQGNCGSCWAFGAVAAFEAKILIKDGVTRNLSEQFLVSCNNEGFSCLGGWWIHDYHWYKYVSGESGAGARYESEFPYAEYDATCYSPYTPHEKIEGWYYTDDVTDSAIPYYEHWPSTAQIKQKIYDYGPVATALCSQTFNSYYGGVHYSHCSSTDHIVLITGWDDADGCFYVKNSWGTSWGENGYIRLAYNYCNVGHNSTYLIYNENSGGGNPPEADFSASPTSVTEGGSVAFSDASTNSPSSWSWSFPGGSPSSSSAQSPNVTYSSAGTYSVTLTVTNSYGSDTLTKSSYITVTSSGGGGGGYCASNGNSSSYEWISAIQVGSFSNSSGAATGGYADFTSQTASLSAGSSVSVSLTPGFSGNSYTESWKIWIDYDGDETFGSSEEVFSGTSSSTVNGSFTVSSSASGTTRMRISMRYNSAPPACGSFDYGEVEDYGVGFGGTPPPPPPPSTYCTASHLYDYGYITRLQVGSIDNSSSFGTNGYADFTSQSTNMSRGSSYSFTITCLNQHWSSNVIGVWVDWNQDGDWSDSGETEYTFTGTGPYSGTISVPSSAATGSTRMRIRMLYDKSAVPCGDDNFFGEAEDYTIVVQ